MLQKLRRKFVAVFMLVSTLQLILLLTTIYQYTAANLEAENIRLMQSVNDSVGPVPFAPGAPRPDGRLHYFILGLTPSDELLVVNHSNFDLTDTELLQEFYSIAVNNPSHTGELEEYALRYTPLITPREDLYVFADISEELATLASLRKSCIFIGLGSMVALLIVSTLLAKWMVRPVEQSWEQQKQFVSDASHELKTPLTVIMTNTELLSSPDFTEAEKAGFTENISVMTQRMRTLVEGMLDLARVDNGVVQSTFTKLDLSQLVDECTLPFEPLYFEANRFLDTTIEPNLTFTGSEAHLRRVVDILLDNALKYSDEHSTIYLTLQKHAHRIVLCVDSAGAAISPDDLSKIFRRFYRVDQARTSGSYGLGLSIAEGIVTEHKGKIWAESTNGRNKFFVSFPL